MTANRIIFNSIYPGERQSPLSFLLIAKVVVDVVIKDHCIATIRVVPWVVVDGGVVLVSLVVGHLFLCQGKKGYNTRLCYHLYLVVGSVQVVQLMLLLSRALFA